MQGISLNKFLTVSEIRLARKLWNENANGSYAAKVAEQIIKPNILRINQLLGQENDPMYLAYAIEYAMMTARTT